VGVPLKPIILHNLLPTPTHYLPTRQHYIASTLNTLHNTHTSHYTHRFRRRFGDSFIHTQLHHITPTHFTRYSHTPHSTYPLRGRLREAQPEALKVTSVSVNPESKEVFVVFVAQTAEAFVVMPVYVCVCEREKGGGGDDSEG
jgi:hypothetical protein